MNIISGGGSGNNPGIATITFQVSNVSYDNVREFTTWLRNSVEPLTVLNFRIDPASIEQIRSVLNNLTATMSAGTGTGMGAAASNIAAVTSAASSATGAVSALNNAFTGTASSAATASQFTEKQYADTLRLQSAMNGLTVFYYQHKDAIDQNSFALQRYNELVGQYDLATNGGVFTGNLGTALAEINAAKSGMTRLVAEERHASAAGGELAASLGLSTKQIASANAQLKTMHASLTQAYGRNKELIAANSGLSAQYTRLMSSTANPSMEMLKPDAIRATRLEVNGLLATTRAMSLETQSLGAYIGGALKNRLKYLVGMGVWSAALAVLRKVISSAREIDKHMVNLRIITQQTDAAYEAFGERAAAVAVKIGRSISDVVSSAETWARLGYSLDESATLAGATGVFANVADVSESEATSALTSVLKAYDYEAGDAMHIVDILTQVGQKYAISASELGTALEKGGAALATANNSLEESVALMAAGNAAVQNADTVGTALKTTTLRLAGSKAELEAMGEDVDDLASSTSKMRKEVLALSGVDIMKDANTYKSTYQILKEIAAVWDNISNVSQMALLEGLAGKRNASVIASVINNLKDLEGAYDDAMNSAGVAEKAQEEYMRGIEGHMGALSASFEELSISADVDFFIKAVIDLCKYLTQFITLLADTHALLPLVAGGITLVVKARKALAIAEAASTTATQLRSLGDGAANARAYATQLTLLTPAIQKQTLALLALNPVEKEAVFQEMALIGADSALMASTEGVTAKQLTRAVVQKGVNKELWSQVLAEAGVTTTTEALTEAERQEIVATLAAKVADKTLTDELRLQYLQMLMNIGGIDGMTGSMGLFSGMLKVVQADLKRLFAFLRTPKGVITAILAALAAAAALYLKVRKTQQDYVDDATAALDEAEEAQRKLEENISAYDELIKRRRELLELGDAATVNELNELSIVDERIAKLEYENEVLKAQQKLKGKESYDKLLKAYGGETFYDEGGSWRKVIKGNDEEDSFDSLFYNIVYGVSEIFDGVDMSDISAAQEHRYEEASKKRKKRIQELNDRRDQLTNDELQELSRLQSQEAIGFTSNLYSAVYGFQYRNEDNKDVVIGGIHADNERELVDVLSDENEALVEREELISGLEALGYKYNKNATTEAEQQFNNIVKETKLRRDMYLIASGSAMAYEQTLKDLVEFGELDMSAIGTFLTNVANEDWQNTEEGSNAIAQMAATLNAYGFAIGDITADDALPKMIQLLQAFYTNATRPKTALEQEIDRLKALTDLKEPIEAITKAQKEMADTGYLSYDTYKKIIDLELGDYIVETADGYKLATGAMDAYISKSREALEADVASARARLESAQAAVSEAAALDKVNREHAKSIKILTGNDKLDALYLSGAWQNSSEIKAAQAELNKAQAALDNFNRYVKMFQRDASGSSSKSTEDAFLKQWEDVNNAMKHEVEMGVRTQASYMEWLRTTTTRGVAGSYLNANAELYEKYKDKIWSVQEEIRKYDLEQLDKQKDAFESLVDFRIKMLEEETKKQKEELDKRKDDLEDFYDKQLEMLEDQFDEEDYLEEQAEKRKELADMRRQMEMLERDDSAWAKKRLAELRDEYHEAEEDYRKWERDHARDAVKKTLEDERDAAIKEIEDAQEALDKQSEDAAALRRQAIEDILSGNKSIMDAMEQFSIEQGSWLDDNIVDKWRLAQEGVVKYGQSVAALNALFGVDKDSDAYRFWMEIASGSYQKHASGTSYASGGWAITQDAGPEAIMSRIGGMFTLLNPGDKVFSATATDFLYAFANNPMDILASGMSRILSRNSVFPAFAGTTGNSTTNIDMGDVIIQGNADEKTVSEFRREKRKLVNDLLQEFKKLR